MRVVDKLLNLHRRDRDAWRRYAAQLELLAERLRADASRLRAGIESAGGRASAGSLVDRYRQLQRSIGEIEAQLATARDALAVAERQCERCERDAADPAGARDFGERRPLRRARPARPACADSTGNE